MFRVGGERGPSVDLHQGKCQKMRKKLGKQIKLPAIIIRTFLLNRHQRIPREVMLPST